MSGGIIYDYEDGGTYCGEWEGETSHGFGVCTGPKGEGTFEGQWEHGNQVSGVYRWPNGVQYSGTWEDNARHGQGVETRTDGTEYSGDFTRGIRGPFGVARLPNGVYQGQWANGAQDGEGVETYRDQGCYRGQYKKGLRCGYGTRTSAAYEARPEDRDLPTSTSEPSLQAMIAAAPDTPTGSLKRINLLKAKQAESSASLKTSYTSNSLQSTPGGISLGKSGLREDLAQVYEGEWLEDKRQGHGVLKVLSKYTYYGQWARNTITGYGVMVYENGTKREGEWHNGTLIAVVKRHKVLMFKTHQLESKVKEARTKALQAAESARHKAELAASRASSAVNKSRVAAKAAEKARSHAQQAVEKAELYQNAPRVAESLKSPVSGTNPMVFSPVDIDHTPSSSSMPSSVSSSTSSRLSVNTTVVPSSSFEDLHGMYAEKGSDSPGSTRRYRISTGDVGVAWDERKQRMAQYNSSSSEQSFESTESRRSRRTSDSAVGRGKWRQQRRVRSHSLSDHEEETEDDGYEGQRSMLRQRVDKRTGEVGHEDGSDDDSHDKSSSIRGGARGSGDALTLDMLNQMAKWNRTVAFLNFSLLMVLLVLILLVFASMYYYRLLSYYQNHPDPEDQTSPGGFLTPLA